MNKTKEISNFFFSQYFSEGLKITFGCIVPVVICAYFGKFEIGMLISLGALLVGLSDTPGAPSHRRLGMLSTAVLCMLTYIVIVHVNFSVTLTTISIALLSFMFAMFAVFNSRAATVGSMCTLMMLFNVHEDLVATNVWLDLLYMAIGGAWYMIISMSMIQIRPYRIAQQELSESIRQVADYIRLKANFYNPKTDFDENYLKLVEKQIEVNTHQERLRDILFQSKRSIKDTTKIGRLLTLIFTDIIDLFEHSMATQYDYNAIRDTYAKTGILPKFKLVLIKISNDMDNMAYALNANQMPKPLYRFENDINELKSATDEIERSGLNTIPLKKLIINIRTIIRYLENIYSYGSSKISEIPKEEIDSASQFITKDQIDWKKFRDNLSLKSSVFRHALRMSVVLSMTYLTLSVIEFNPKGIYWTLLTIMVILKPGFALSQERNVQRLIGTVVGGIIGGIVLMTIQDETVKFILLIFFFLTAYSLFRVNYIASVVFMTPYVLILLSFNGMNSFEMAKERVFDTLLGGAIAFLSSYVLFPNWESSQFMHNMRSLLIANYKYMAKALPLLNGQDLTITEYKLARKEVYIASANMTSTFQRMLSEPKWQQKHTKEINRFVILSHIFSSYAATFLVQVQQADNEVYHKEHVKLLRKILIEMEKAISLLPEEVDDVPFSPSNQYPSLRESGDNEEEDSKLITEQLQFLSKISGDLYKVTQEAVNTSEETQRPMETA